MRREAEPDALLARLDRLVRQTPARFKPGGAGLNGPGDLNLVLGLIADLDAVGRGLRQSSGALRLQIDRTLVKINAANAYRSTGSLCRSSYAALRPTAGVQHAQSNLANDRWL